jgi:hypothetical protein
MVEGFAPALAAFDRAMRATGAPYMIIGGIAVIARGVPRHTDDLDGTIWADGLDLSALLSGLQEEHIEPRIADALEFARQNQVFLLRHVPTSTDIDLSLAWLPFEKDALAAAELVDLRGVEVPVARAEDLVIYKAAAFRDRDRSDIERLLKLYGGSMDIPRIVALGESLPRF